MYLFVALWYDLLASSTPPVPFPVDAGTVFSSFMAACRCPMRVLVVVTTSTIRAFCPIYPRPAPPFAALAVPCALSLASESCPHPFAFFFFLQLPARRWEQL